MNSPYAKFAVAIIGAIATALLATYPDNPDVQQWGTIVVAILTSLGVYAVPNKPNRRL